MLGPLDLAGVLAELGRDLGQAQRGEELGLGPAGDRAVRPFEGVLVERPAPRQGPPPHRDVVGLRAREIMKRERELGVGRPPGGRTGHPLASRTLALVGPCASTAATSGSLTNRSSTGAGSAALKRMSRSPIVSARRRRLPQTSARITPG